jgi:hypothetical protein
MSDFESDRITEIPPTDLHASPVKNRRLKVFGEVGVKYCFWCIICVFKDHSSMN